MSEKRWDDLVEPARGALEALIKSGDDMVDRMEELEVKNEELVIKINDAYLREVSARRRAQDADAAKHAAVTRLNKAIDTMRTIHNHTDPYIPVWVRKTLKETLAELGVK